MCSNIGYVWNVEGYKWFSEVSLFSKEAETVQITRRSDSEDIQWIDVWKMYYKKK